MENMREDARILGLVRDSRTVACQLETTGEDGLLLNILPHVGLHYKRLLVMGVMMGVGTHVASLVAHEMTKGRVSFCISSHTFSL